MSQAWITSDLHIGHTLVAGLRGYDDPLQHDISIAETWRKFVRTDDVVWVLGDISSGKAEEQKDALIFLSELPGRKYLVAGNHDQVHPMYGSAARKWDEEYRTAFEYVCSQAVVSISKKKVMLSHFPYAADHTSTPRYGEWRLRDCGNWLIHGHTHDSLAWKSEYPKEIHVGWDAHKAPVSMNVIVQFINDAETNPSPRFPTLLK